MFPEDTDNEDFYSGGGREDMVDNDGMSADEEAFMNGYDEERNKTAQDNDDSSTDEDPYEEAFATKKRRRSKRSSESFDEEEIEAEVTLH